MRPRTFPHTKFMNWRSEKWKVWFYSFEIILSPAVLTDSSDQDKALDTMLQSVGNQKRIAVLIGEEAHSSVYVLLLRLLSVSRLEIWCAELAIFLTSKVLSSYFIPVMFSFVHLAEMRIKNTISKVEVIHVESSTKALWITICILVLVFLVVVFLAMYI
jgi:hypothetical protein